MPKWKHDGKNVNKFQAKITNLQNFLPFVAIFEVNLQDTSAHFEKY